jgi:hypothetical protein
MYRLHADSAVILREGGVAIDGANARYIYRIYGDDDFASWLTPLRTNGQLAAFLNADPKKGIVSSDQAKKLATWANAAGSDAEAKQIFEKVYPTLNTTGRSGEFPAPWTAAPIGRLFGILASQLPVGHVQTVTGGFTLMRKHTKADGTVVVTNFAWWNPDIFRVVLNESSSGAGGGGTGHDMTGGGGSGANSNYTKTDGTAGTQTSQSHFQGSAMHEVGHGVGARMGGDAYAENPSSYPQWTNVGRSAWINELWTGSAAVNGAAPASTDDSRLSASDAKDFFATEISEGSGKYSAGWFNNASRAQIAQYCNYKFGNEPLGKYWNAVVNGNLGPDNAYSAANPERKQSGWAYGYLTRFHGHPWAKFKAEAYDNKVSWYGISSPKEWWAEQYAHYYRTEKTGGGLIDPATKTFLDDLDKKAFLPTNDSGTHGITVAAGAAAGGSDAPLRQEPAMFPW